MNCMEFLQESSKEARNAIENISDTSYFTVERINDIYNAFQLRSIAYSLAVIADKLSEEGERNE